MSSHLQFAEEMQDYGESPRNSTQRMKAKILPISLTLIVGAIGFMIGRSSTSNGNGNGPDVVVNGADNAMSDRAGSRANDNNDSFTSSTRRSNPASRVETEKPTLSANAGTPLERLKALDEISDPLERARKWLQLVDSLTPEQFQEFVAAFRAQGMSSERVGDYAILLTAWAKVNPLEALDYASKATGNPFARQTILASWAATDPDSAIAWAKANHTGDGANPWMVGVIKGLAYQDPDRASALLKEMPRSVERGEALDNLLPALLKRGIAETRNWVDAITDPALKEGAILRVAESTAEQDPLGTADWLVANPSESANRRIDDALYAMAGKDQGAALAYFNKLPTGDVRSNALRGIINAVAVENPQKAAALMDTYSGDVSDRVVQQFVWHSFHKDPQTAISNISRMADQDERDRMYSRSLEWWMRRDQQAALNWVNSNTLPTNVVERLQRDLHRQEQRSK